MNRNLYWKLLFIVALTLISLWKVYPPKEKLKQGLDLAGGTSLVYEIDTTGLTNLERKGLAQSMIPILLKRIDPTHMANIIMRPQGDTRIEIQLPLSSPETIRKRQAYEHALLALEKENINLLSVRKTLSLDPALRSEKLAEYANGDESRIQLLNTLAETYDLRSSAQKKRDELAASMEQALKPLEEQKMDIDSLRSNFPNWAVLEGQERENAIKSHLRRYLSAESQPDGDALTAAQQAAFETVRACLDLYSRWADVVNELTEPKEGLNARWDQAAADMSRLNLSIEQLRSILDLPPDSAKRQEAVAQLKQQFPERAEKITEVVNTFTEYSSVGGRLDDPEDLKRMLKGAGVLEFRILPAANDGKSNMEELRAYEEALRTKGPKLASEAKYIWIEIEDPDNWPEELGITGSFGEKEYVLASGQPNECMLHTGDKRWKLTGARPTYDDNGRPAISFAFNQVGANLFFNLTHNNLQRPLCIILDDLALSAPTIQTEIRSQGQITSSPQKPFTQTEVADMVNKLNAGSFRAKLSDVPISEKTIGATIGADNRKQGIQAGYISFFAVTGFMLLYYLFGGIIADIAVALNILFILALMAALNGTFTLPGIGGLILTIGMSVDANVLIFERIREEQKRGSSLREAIANGYSRALPTIIDSNLTTILTALILLMVASEEIKGFAMVLMIGLFANMFTSVYATRVFFTLLLSRKWISGRLQMLAMFQNLNINWMGLRPFFLSISGILLAVGLAVFFTRDDSKNSKYDIEYTGGTLIQIDLKAGMGYTVKEVRDRLSKYAVSIGNDPLQTAKVNSVGKTGNQYEISTTETNKSIATVTFPEAEKVSRQTVLNDIQKTSDQLGQTLTNLNVIQMNPAVFQITTSRVSKTLVEEVLQTAFGSRASISDVQVVEVVSDAVRSAFADLLDIRDNLHPEIVSVDTITAADPILSEYLGGAMIRCRLNADASGKEIETRISDTRIKPGLQNLKWYRWAVLNTDLTEMAPDQNVREFVYISVDPEAGYREFSQEEWNRYVENEKEKLTSALTIESSLARITQIDPTLGKEAKVRAMLAIVLSMIVIVGYIWFRFGNLHFGLGAILSLVHDVTITLGMVVSCYYLSQTAFGRFLGIADFKINLEMIAAFLTLIGYSLNDTIVVFDRIRENRKKTPLITRKLINDSINQTLSRTILTSFTTFLAVLIMYIWGGAGLRGFTFVMLVGIVIGTYSSIAVAAPFLLLGESKK